MKKMWKNRKDAVSPVIATILMVAITVVLAAVLYVMVMGFGGGGGDQTPTITMTYQKTGSYSLGSNYTFTVVGVTANDVLWDNIQIICTPAAGALPTAPEAGPTAYVNAGETLVFTGLDAGNTYAITLNYKPTNSAAYQVNILAT